jgi:hypothetical protein
MTAKNNLEKEYEELVLKARDIVNREELSNNPKELTEAYIELLAGVNLDIITGYFNKHSSMTEYLYSFFDHTLPYITLLHEAMIINAGVKFATNLYKSPAANDIKDLTAFKDLCAVAFSQSELFSSFTQKDQNKIITVVYEELTYQKTESLLQDILSKPIFTPKQNGSIAEISSDNDTSTYTEEYTHPTQESAAIKSMYHSLVDPSFFITDNMNCATLSGQHSCQGMKVVESDIYCCNY